MKTSIVLILLASMLMSFLLSLVVWQKRQNLRLSLLAAVMTNTVILALATLIFYRLDLQTTHKQVEGLFASLGMTVFITFIPILTIIDLWAISLWKTAGKRTANL